MFENITKFFKKFNKNEKKDVNSSKEAAKERLHLVLMQDRANVSADFLELMKQEIIEVIKKYIDVDEKAIDVRLTNKDNGDGTTGAPALYANIPIKNIKNEARKVDSKKEDDKKDLNKEEVKEDKQESKKEEENKVTSSEEEKIKKERTGNEEQVKEVKQKENVQNKTKEKVKSEN